MNVQRLKRSVRRIVDEHIAGKELLARAPRKLGNPGLFQTVPVIRLTKPDMTSGRSQHSSKKCGLSRHGTGEVVGDYGAA